MKLTISRKMLLSYLVMALLTVMASAYAVVSLRQLNGLGVAYDESFYRTGAGAEVDLVVEGMFGRIAFEIKFAQSLDLRALRSLRDFVEEQKARLGVLISNDVSPRLYDEKLIGIPFSWL